jgi:MoaA/NifB/PqqE/SkfB family radical SAM enzyme
MARRFPRTALNLAKDCIAGVTATPFPRRIGLFVTNRCDFACSMCAVLDARNDGLSRGGDMPFEIVEHVISESASFQPIVDLIGGEPLLYSRLPDAIRFASEKSVPAVLTTNGLKLRERAEAIVQAGLLLLQVSLDGWDEQSQAARGNVANSFQRLCDGVRAIQAARGRSAFPIIRILTAITSVNHAHLDQIQRVVADLSVPYWGISNYFYLNRGAHERHRAFALIHNLSGTSAAHAIADDIYLSPGQVRDLRLSLERVKRLNRRLGIRIAYAWEIDVERYYSTHQAARSCRCDLPYTRLDVHADGHMAVCVSGQHVGQVSRDRIADVWRGRVVRDYRRMYERTKPMPMCFRCCGLSQSIRFEE